MKTLNTFASKVRKQYTWIPAIFAGAATLIAPHAAYAANYLNSVSGGYDGTLNGTLLLIAAIFAVPGAMYTATNVKNYAMSTNEEHGSAALQANHAGGIVAGLIVVAVAAWIGTGCKGMLS
ncbi:MAG: hypothetical protein FWF45_00665 [Coriobacteriia bacterium]|nr:hypothetical protein [Coriobacteriia bacterium]